MLLILVVSLLVFVGVFYLASMLYPSAEKQALFWHKKKMDQVSPKLDQMFVDISPAKLIFMDLACPVAGGFLGYMVAHANWAIFVGLGVGFLVPQVIIKFMQKRRRKKFAGQLVDAIMILASSLKVGMSLQQSFEVLTQEMTPPTSQEFSLVLRQIQMGFSLESSLFNMKKRIQLEDLDMVISSLMVARDTGGDIIDTLNKVAATISERNKLLGKVKALTVQAKLQGIIMSAIPVVFAIFVIKSDPHFFDAFLKEDMGKALLVYAVISQILGTFFIIKLSKVDI